MLPPEGLALVASLCIATGAVVMKQGLRTSTRETAVFVSVGVQAVIFLGLSVTSDAHFAADRPWGLAAFAISGLIGSVVARFLIATSIDDVGLARAMPVRTSTPVFSAIIAILLFGERLTVAIGVGTLLVVGGLGVLTYEAYRDRDSHHATGRQGLLSLLPILGGSLLLGFTPSLRKFGLGTGTSILGGLAINFGLAFATFGVYYLLFHRHGLRQLSGAIWFVGTGIFWSLGFWCYFAALQAAPTVVIVPLFTTNPLFVILLSGVFLSDIEDVTVELAFGGIIAVFGAILVLIG